MATMAKMRSLAPWFMILVGGAFVLFMMLSDSNLAEYFGSQRQNIGSVNGEPISYQEFSALLDQFQKQQEQQTGQAIEESQLDFFREQVWDYLVSQKLLAKKRDEFGIIVTDEEVRNHILGPNPPEFLRQQFVDSTGNFNRELYETTLRDPRNKEIVISVENQIRDQLIQEKLVQYIGASVVASDDEARERFIERNIRMKAKYVFVDINTIPEADLKITDAEIKNYYNSNPDEFKVDATRKLKYVLFNRMPTLADTQSIFKNLESIAAKIKTDTASFKSYVDIYSDLPFSKDTISLTDFTGSERNTLASANKGDVVGPILGKDGASVFKLIDKVKAKNDKVRASHILVRTTGDDKKDLEKINSIYNEVTKSNDFATVAKAKSEDGSAPNGGDLGWFGKGQMVKEFEEASFKGQVGVIQKPIKSVFGYHIIKVTDRSNQDIVVERIVNKIEPSATTLDKLYTSAEDFVFIARENGFESEAKVMKYQVVETPPITEAGRFIPGVGANSALIKFAFTEDVGAISEVHKVPSGYIVAMISDAVKPGVRNFEEAKDLAKNSVLKEKRLKKSFEIISNIKKKIDDTGNVEDAKSILASARIDTTSEFTTQGNVPGIGRDFGFTNYALTAELNKWSAPVRGSLGSYLMNVTYRTKFDEEVFNFEKSPLKREIISQKKNRVFSQWVQDLKKEADIEDNRHFFFR